MAIAMPIQQDIRRYDRQGMPHARIARELGVDRGTVAKYARQEDCSPQPKRDRRFGRKTDAYAALIDQMLEADRMMPRKQRHTARRIFDRLVAEHGFDGSYSVVRRYVNGFDYSIMGADHSKTLRELQAAGLGQNVKMSAEELAACDAALAELADRR